MSLTNQRTVDITPTWRGVLLLLLETYKSGTDKGRSDALKELYRMADAADRYNEQAKGE